ncbi:MAG: ATP--guanido phosphotransferase, partial [Verrucomicrobiota bacterium]|nr:ATP--guanido phosphotransferase [Verrucomicrobiota bacterium]
SKEFGYLTACPTNLGTALRASVMMHLPGLVISGHMEKVTRAVNQLGIIVRGLFGEGSDATGHIFQISNQQTLGESEEAIISRLGAVFKTIIDHEINARFKYLEENRSRLLDQIGRAFGILQNAHVLSSNEAMSMLSLIRLAVDFEILPELNRTTIDRLFIECQPGHIQHAAGEGIEANARDISR